ncbi:MAG: FmdB family zinc ribbon protein [Terriglobia bacterium]
MPIFEYKCRECGSKFETIVGSSSAQVTCQRCSSARVERLLSTFAVSGSGRAESSPEPGPCACGAPRRGMCGD